MRRWQGRERTPSSFGRERRGRFSDRRNVVGGAVEGGHRTELRGYDVRAERMRCIARRCGCDQGRAGPLIQPEASISRMTAVPTARTAIIINSSVRLIIAQPPTQTIPNLKDASKACAGVGKEGLTVASAQCDRFLYGATAPFHVAQTVWRPTAGGLQNRRPGQPNVGGASVLPGLERNQRTRRSP